MKTSSLLLLTLTFIFLSCAGGLKGFKEPTSADTMLVVGRVVLEDNYYTEELGTYFADIEVAVLGKTEDGKTQAMWANTDENGYFALADVPKGEYVLKGIRALIGTGALVTVTNRLRLSTDVYVISARPQVIFNGQYFPYEPVGRIQSLQHNIFRLDRMSKTTNQVNYTVKHSLAEYKLNDGKVVNDGPVEEYYMSKYPDSAWNSALQESAQIIRFKR
jgi:hypothetical protein